MNINKHVEVVNCDCDGHVLFVGVSGAGKTRIMLQAVASHPNPGGRMIHVVDPYGDIAQTIAENPDKLSNSFFKTLMLFQHVEDLPKTMDNTILVIDDGRGYLSWIMQEEKFTGSPTTIFCTVQVAQPVGSL